MSLTTLLAINLAVTAVFMLLIWLGSVYLRDVSIVDAFWGLGFVLIAGLTYVLTGESSTRKLLLVAMTTIWGVRLAAYLAWRKWGTPEDYRYAAMRKSIGPRFWWMSLLIVFGLQGLIMNIVALPITVGQWDATPLHGGAMVGVGMWAVGLLFETVGDLHLALFKANPENRGKVLDRGLWRYTRHPNYFGDFLIWWGLYLTAVTEETWWTVLGPIVMSILLMYVSGVTLLERTLKQGKDGYADYMARTSSFFPWPPREKSAN